MNGICGKGFYGQVFLLHSGSVMFLNGGKWKMHAACWIFPRAFCGQYDVTLPATGKVFGLEDIQHTN